MRSPPGTWPRTFWIAPLRRQSIAAYWGVTSFCCVLLPVPPLTSARALGGVCLGPIRGGRGVRFFMSSKVSRHARLEPADQRRVHLASGSTPDHRPHMAARHLQGVLVGRADEVEERG